MISLEPSLLVTLAAVFFTVNTAPTDANSCTGDQCNPKVDCGDIAWTCDTDTLTTPAPGAPPREDQYCCDYFGTCDSNSAISGKVTKRTMNVKTSTGQEHKTDWLDLYVSGNEHVGTWVTYIEDLPDPITSDTPYNITDFYSEPGDVCTEPGNTHKYPGWYHVALASLVRTINITGLTIQDPASLTCNSNTAPYSYVCSGDTCNSISTNLAGSAVVTKSDQASLIKCYAEMGDGLMLSTNASSTLLADLDGKSPIDDIALLYGWVPLLDDTAPYVKVVFRKPMYIVGIKTGGLTQDVERSVDSFNVSYGEVDNNNDPTGKEIPIGVGGKTYYGGAHLDTWVTNYFPDVYRAESVTINVLSPLSQYVGMRFRILGCTVCDSSTECVVDGEEGQCSYPDKKCDYSPAVQDAVDPVVVEKGLDELGAQNVSEEGKSAYTQLMGHANTSEDINPADVDSSVASVVVDSLFESIQTPESSNDGEPTKTLDKNIATAINQATVLLGTVLSDENSAVVTNLNTKEEVDKALDTVLKATNLCNTLLNASNTAAWEQSISTNQEVNSETTTASSGPGDGTKTTPDPEQAAKAAEDKQKAMAQKAADMMKGIQSITTAIVSAEGSSEPVKIETPNLVAVAQKAEPATVKKEGYQLETTSSNDLGAKLNIPASSFGSLGDDGEEVKKIAVSTVVLDSTVIRQAAEKAYKEATGDPNAKMKQVLASSLLSFDLTVNGKKQSIPLDFELGHNEIRLNEEGEPIERAVCVFHDTTVVDDAFATSTKGMRVKESSSNKTDCEAKHTTTFAVMMYLDDTDELGKHFMIQSKLTTFCGVLSVLFVAFAVAVFSYLRSTLMSERIMIHVILMAVTGGGMLTFMLGAGRTENLIVCKIVTVVLHFMYTAMFAWMLNEGIHLYRQIITVFETGKPRFWIYHVIGWGIPVVVVGVSAGMQWDKYGHGPVCFLDYEDGTLWSFVGPIIPVILINFVVLIRVTQIVIGASKLDGDGGTVNSVKAGVRSSLMLLPLLGMTWVVGYFQHLHISLSYVFVLLNALQGFFMAIFHCFFNTEVREGLKGAFKKLKANSVAGESSIAEFTNKRSLISTVTTTESHGNKVAPMSPFDE